MISAQKNGLPIFVSEYGICDASGNGAIDLKEAAAWSQTMDEYGISRCMWNLSNKNESSAMLKDSCTKDHGFTEEDLSEAGLWLFKRLQGELLDEDEYVDEEFVAVEDSELAYKIKEKNSWESNGLAYYQYEITVSNTGEASVNGWKIQIPYGLKYKIEDHWNCEVESKDGYIELSSLDYNAVIESGGKVLDVGLIVSVNED